jgi:hypothetical protein
MIVMAALPQLCDVSALRFQRIKRRRPRIGLRIDF